MNKQLFCIINIIIIIFFSGCRREAVPDSPDRENQRILDIEVIENYIIDNNLEPIDTTASGARYKIIEFGDGDSVHANDIVTIDLIEKDVRGEIFRTTLPSVADTTTSLLYDPFVFTYTLSGWATSNINQIISFQRNGLKEAISNSFYKMKTGGHLMVILPSDLAYFAATPIPYVGKTYSVIIYDIYIVSTR